MPLYRAGFTPPGSNKQVIFNDSGVLGADSGMTYDKATDTLTIGGNVVAAGSLAAELASAIGNTTPIAAGSIGLTVKKDLSNVGTVSTVRLFGYSPSLEFLDKDSVQNWYVGLDDANSDQFRIGRGYGPNQGLDPDIRITTGGTIGIRGQLNLDAGKILFPSGQLASADANCLDDYEEGSWTPTLGGDGGTSGQTYGTRVGEYVKIGQMVIATCRIELTAKGTITGNVNMQGLPFTLGNTANLYVSGVLTYFANLSTNWISVGCFGATGQSAGLIIGRQTAGTSVQFFATADITNTTAFALAMCYRTSA